MRYVREAIAFNWYESMMILPTLFAYSQFPNLWRDFARFLSAYSIRECLHTHPHTYVSDAMCISYYKRRSCTATVIVHTFIVCTVQTPHTHTRTLTQSLALNLRNARTLNRGLCGLVDVWHAHTLNVIVMTRRVASTFT